MILRTHKFLLCFQKIKMVTSQTRFRSTDNKLSILWNVYKNLKIPCNWQIATQTITKTNTLLLQATKFSNSASVLLNFFIELSLLEYCLLHVETLLQRYDIFCRVMSMSKFISINYMICFSLSFSLSIKHIISLKQPHLFIWTFLSNVQPRDVA